MLAGLLLWSLATIAVSFAHLAADPLVMLAGCRCFFGLASAVALPAVTASVSAYVPKARRGKMLTYIYAAFNVGSILGVAMTPPLVRDCPLHANSERVHDGAASYRINFKAARSSLPPSPKCACVLSGNLPPVIA